MDKKSIISLLVILVVVVLAGWILFGGEETAAPTVFTFDSPLSANGWVLQGSGSIDVSSGSLQIKNNGESYLISPPFYLNTEEDPILKIEAQVYPPLVPLQIYWLPQNQNQFDFSQNFDLDPGAFSRLKSYYFSFKNTRNQPMNVSRLLFKLPVGVERLDLKKISFLREENKQGFLANWQAFWAIPAVTVRTVNRINAPLWGQASLMVVLYWLIAIAFFAALIVYGIKINFKKINLNEYLSKVLLAAIGVLFIGWIAYDLRFSYDYLRIAYRQSRYFVFKNADSKRDVTFGRSVTDFVGFYKDQIPLGSKYIMKIQDDYQRLVIANALVPDYCVDNIEKAQYVIGAWNAAENIKGFKMYRSYNNGQGWILKREE